ncbi:MAG: arginine--tRNA ligase, partial [Flavobacteriaceae bacterium]|nr:arginine--tRNA ligase [Flavobacteriaceae bacterium]
MDFQKKIEITAIKAIREIYHVEIDSVEFQSTRKEFEGDITLVIFPLLRLIKGNPAEIGIKIGEYIQQHLPEIIAFNVIKGFLNLVANPTIFLKSFQEIYQNEHFGKVEITPENKSVMVEYSSPNTNKPLHLGHIRNNLLGYSVAKIIEASGKKVIKTQIINDRGIHICKSMLAWELFGNG